MLTKNNIPKLLARVFMLVLLGWVGRTKVTKPTPVYTCACIYLRGEGTKASLWLRGCSQGRLGQRRGVQEEVMGHHRGKRKFVVGS